MKPLERFPLPDYLQWYMERNIGRVPIWQFSDMPAMPNGMHFKRLNFENRHHFLAAFQNDSDEWVDERFKDPKALYEYVANMRIVAPYSGKHGACDYLVYQERTCIGVLHAFDFSRETYTFHHRRCNVGYAFVESLRGTGQPLEVVQYFIAFLFESFDFLFLAAHTEFENARSIRFLEKLGFEALPPDSEDHYRFFRLYRSEESRGEVEQGRRGY